jgi:hypothetical protein
LQLKYCTYFSSSHACYMSCPCHHILFDHLNDI